MSAYVPLAPLYDELTRDVPYEEFADFYEKLFGICGVSPETVLDLACGTGTLTCMMAERGYEMIGVDMSPEMLAEASEKADGLTDCVRPMFLCQSMEELDLYGTVSAAVCSLDGINYVEPELLPEVFRRLHLFVEPGGIVIFDINTPEKLRAQDGEVYIDETDDVFCVWRAQLDEDENACIYGMDMFTADGDSWIRSQEEHVEYIYTTDFLTECLENAGFGEVKIYGELRTDAPEPGEQRVFFTARRM